ncbi:MAG: tRNA lysidine(34) synthetase TilS [Anaerovoracaceae bacterium]|jgi:tRNA(Ile)-lysidine synthase
MPLKKVVIKGEIEYNQNMVINKVKKTIAQNNLIEKGEHIVIGLSGGPDSVCLFHVLWRLSKEWGLHLHAVHVNHQLRGKAADADQAYTEDLCASMNVPCHVFTSDVATLAKDWNVTEEEAGRKIRYRAFEEIRQEILIRRKGEIIKDNPAKGVKIAVAQNLNDQVETVLMRVLRGTGIDGLAGMEYVRDGIIIRPLLDVNREEIEEYCLSNDLNPRVDMTNLEPVYTRNKIRLELIPYLEKNFNPGIMKALRRLSRNASEDKDYIDGGMIKCELSASGKQCNFLLESLQKAHPALLKRSIVRGFKEIGLEQDIASVHLESAERIIREGRTSARMDFPGGYGLRISYDRVELYRKQDKRVKNEFRPQGIAIDQITVEPITIAFPGGEIMACIIDGKQPMKDSKNPSARLDMGKLKGQEEEITLRTRRAGDFIVPLGMKGTKKIQDFFVDSKIPKEKREEMPLICLGSEVLWVPGYRINDKYKVEETTEEILYLEYECGL